MGEKGFFIIFAILVVSLFVMGANGGGITNTASSTPVHVGGSTAHSQTVSQGQYPPVDYRVSNSGDPLARRPNAAIQADLEDLYDELWELEQKVDSVQRKLPASQYAKYVTLTQSASGSTNPDREYLTLTIDPNAPPIPISDWYVESYVTEHKMAIPDGTKIYRSGGVINKTRPITLTPGQRAYLITGESPIGVSFQENMCIGYLRTEENFYPNVSRSCPRPIELMERYGNIALDDDSCYDFVQSQWGCYNIEDDDARFDDLTGSCQRFIENYLNYNSCIDAFSWRTDFEKDDDWYIYFERDEEQWRDRREIIRLFDQYDRVVAVIEYN